MIDHATNTERPLNRAIRFYRQGLRQEAIDIFYDLVHGKGSGFISRVQYGYQNTQAYFNEIFERTISNESTALNIRFMFEQFKPVNMPVDDTIMYGELDADNVYDIRLVNYIHMAIAWVGHKSDDYRLEKSPITPNSPDYNVMLHMVDYMFVRMLREYEQIFEEAFDATTNLTVIEHACATLKMYDEGFVAGQFEEVKLSASTMDLFMLQRLRSAGGLA